MPRMKLSYALPAAALFAASLTIAAEPPAAERDTAEPAVQNIVVEDVGSRIEELRVRGQTQRITVTTKQGGTSTYQIVVGDGSRDTSSTRGAIGQRVWSVLSF